MASRYSLITGRTFKEEARGQDVILVDEPKSLKSTCTVKLSFSPRMAGLCVLPASAPCSPLPTPPSLISFPCRCTGRCSLAMVSCLGSGLAPMARFTVVLNVRHSHRYFNPKSGDGDRDAVIALLQCKFASQAKWKSAIYGKVPAFPGQSPTKKMSRMFYWVRPFPQPTPSSTHTLHSHGSFLASRWPSCTPSSVAEGGSGGVRPGTLQVWTVPSHSKFCAR